MDLDRRRLAYVVLVVCAALAAASLACRDLTGLLAPTPTPTPTPQVLTRAGVVRRIGSVQILQTTFFRVDTVVRAVKEGSWFFNWGGQNLLLFVEGTVTAGIDLSELGEENVEISDESKTIVITLPPAKVLNAQLDDYRIENYRGDTPPNADPALVKEALDAGRLQIADTACESGILQYATRDAEATFAQMMSLADLGDYQLIVKTTPVTDCTVVVE